MKKTTEPHPSNKMIRKPITSSKFSIGPLFALIVICCTLGFSACVPKIVFLEKHRKELEAAEIPMRLVQFYNDKAIILRRRANTSDFKESGGRIIEIDGEQIQEYEIKRGTRCLITGSKDGKYVVTFAGKGKSLPFYRNSKGAFQIYSPEWKNKRGIVNFAGLDFVIEVESNDVILLFKEKRRFKSKPQTRTIKGLKKAR